MSEMIERVALALWRRKRGASDDPNWPVGIDHQGYHQEPYVSSMRAIEWHGFIDQAKTSIEAMREPTEAMTEAGNRARTPSKSVQFNTLGTWADMIAAALSPSREDEGK